MNKLIVPLFCGLFLLFSPAYAQEAQGYMSEQGAFKAILMVISEEGLKEFEKPADQGLHLSRLSKVKRDQRFAVKIGLTGFATDQDMTANVTYDLKFLSPDGTVVGEESKGLVFIQGKVNNASNVYNSEQFLIISFDETDKSGPYKIIAEISDNVSKKKVQLHDVIELID
jgi:hypothetical protein